mmetsp:Transcript_63045/g.131042  ORF Transcript_63045/g.131042 Transcript_63045/m.131042 type:complete len:211 (-) Transcript_63045:529-1161(-)
MSEESEGSGAETVEHQRVREEDGGAAAEAAEDGEGVLGGVGVEDQRVGGPSERQEPHHHDEGADDGGGHEGGVHQDVEPRHAARLKLPEEPRSVVVSMVRRVEHGHEDEELGGLECLAKGRQSVGWELCEEGGAFGIGALPPAEGHEEGHVQHSPHSQHAGVGESSEGAEEAEGEEQQSADSAQKVLAVREEPLHPEGLGKVTSQVADDD